MSQGPIRMTASMLYDPVNCPNRLCVEANAAALVGDARPAAGKFVENWPWQDPSSSRAPRMFC